MLQFRRSCGIWEMGQFAAKGEINSQSQESCKKEKDTENEVAYELHYQNFS